MTGYIANSAMSFAFPGLVTLPVFMGNAFWSFILAVIIGFLVGFLFTLSCHKKLELAKFAQTKTPILNN